MAESYRHRLGLGRGGSFVLTALLDGSARGSVSGSRAGWSQSGARQGLDLEWHRQCGMKEEFHYWTQTFTVL